ncbi:MerR family transcriptional regulator [Lactiplantibacillus herbarum]|uniref:MerR family transcriptional regulator n=1 Tax=Lactiplantibacillus herbarum TaxID=1670446 RepID=UPI00064FF97D|nr:MerR family transcriptional regulator [Lactiplantibacillus herbarum]
MTYTIKEVATKVGLTAYTLRFYDKQGLLPFVGRDQSGYRDFTEGDLHLLHTIICLKNTGMPISHIRQYIDYVMQGPQSIEQRRQLLNTHREAILAQQVKIMANLKEIDFKLDMYSDPAASELVNEELAQAKAEKEAEGLPDPFILVD